jgi:hypothetical protein
MGSLTGRASKKFKKTYLKPNIFNLGLNDRFIARGKQERLQPSSIIESLKSHEVLKPKFLLTFEFWKSHELSACVLTFHEVFKIY